MTDTLVTRADEAIALRLIQAIRTEAETVCAPDTVDLVSVTFDVAASGENRATVGTEVRVRNAGTEVVDGLDQAVWE